MDKTITYKREELYEQVWQEPVCKVARQYGVSDVALAKTCRKVGVPLPGVGYWAKKAAGHRLQHPPLPPLKPYEESELTVTRRMPRKAADLSDETQAALAHESTREAKIIIADALEQPHRLLRGSVSLLRRAARPRSKVDLSQYRCVDIGVSDQVIDRALRVADALLQALDDRGYTVEVTTPNLRDRQTGYPLSRREAQLSVTRVQINGEWIEFALEEGYDSIVIPPPEPAKRRRPYEVPAWIPPPEHERRPNGRLRLRIKNAPYASGHRTLWSDGKVQRVENRLNDFIRGLITSSEHLREQQLERERWKRQRIEEEKLHEEARQRREHEARLVYDLDSRVQDWRTARAITEFVNAVEEDATRRLGMLDPESQLSQWLAWARQRAETLAGDGVGTVLDLRARRSYS